MNRKHELSDVAKTRLEMALQSRGVNKRDLVYVLASYVQAWVCTNRPERIYSRAMKEFRRWKSEVIGPLPNKSGVYFFEGREDAQAAIFLNPKCQSKSFAKWLENHPGEVISTWRRPIIPPTRDMAKKSLLKYYESRPEELLNHYRFVSTDAHELVASLKKNGYTLNALFDLLEKDIYDVIFDEEPVEIIESIATYCGRTRGQSRLTMEMAKFKAGAYYNPFDKEEVIYKGGRLPRQLTHWIDEHGAALVREWRQ